MVKRKLYSQVKMSEKRAEINLDPLKNTVLRKQNNFLLFFIAAQSTENAKKIIFAYTDGRKLALKTKGRGIQWVNFNYEMIHDSG